MDRWETFKGWHHEESLWREIYARTVSTLIAASVILLIGVAAGVIKVHRDQILAVLSVAALMTAALALRLFIDCRRLKKAGVEIPSGLVTAHLLVGSVCGVILGLMILLIFG